MNSRIAFRHVGPLPAIVLTCAPADPSSLQRSGHWPAGLLLGGLLIFSPLLEGGTTHVAAMIIRLMILALAALYCWKGIRAGVFVFPRLRVGAVIAAYLGSAVVSTVASPYGHQSRQWLLVLLGYAGLLYLLVLFMTEWDHAWALAAMLVGMGILEAGWALVQAGWFGTLRPTGTFFNPNFLAGYLAAIWAVVLGLLCYALKWRHGQRQTPHFHIVIAIALLALLLSAVILTGSRGGMLALGVGTVLVAWIRFGRRGLGLLALVLLVSLLVPNPLRDRLKAEHAVNSVTYARWQMWQSSTRAILDHPFGVGLGLYQYVYPRYALPVEGEIARYGKQAQSAHNEYLQMAVELGVIGLGVFIWGVFLLGREAAAALRCRLRRWQRGLIVGASGATAGILAHAAVDSNLHEPGVAIVLILCMGLILSAHRLSGALQKPWRLLPIHTRGSRIIWTAVAVTAVGVLAVTIIRLGAAGMIFEQGFQAVARHETEQAVTNYRFAIALDPEKALYHRALAGLFIEVFERTGDRRIVREAVTELETAMTLNPLDGRLPGLLGRVYQGGGASVAAPVPSSKEEMRVAWLRSAIAAYEQALSLEPFSAFHRFELGLVHLALGDRKKAESRFREAVDLEPNFLPGREWLARVYLEEGRIKEARREYREILDRRRRYDVWIKDPLEQRFLDVDVEALKTELDKAGLHT